MKTIKIIFFCFVLSTTILTACDPTVDRNTLQNSFTPDDIKLEVVQSTPGGNELSIRMLTPGVTGYWDYNVDTKFTDRVDVIYPIPGKATFTYHVTTAYMVDGTPSNVEYITKKIDVQVDTLDHKLPQPYYYLIGASLEGKTWVFNGGPTADGKLWWYMSPPNDPTAWGTAWWNAGGTGSAPADAAGSMTFNLDKGANYIYSAGAGTTPTNGGFSFNSDFTKLTLKGAPILGDKGGSTFVVIKLTDTELILYLEDAGGTGWTWIFKPL